jgi:hypothetical protein
MLQVNLTTGPLPRTRAGSRAAMDHEQGDHVPLDIYSLLDPRVLLKDLSLNTTITYISDSCHLSLTLTISYN